MQYKKYFCNRRYSSHQLYYSQISTILVIWASELNNASKELEQKKSIKFLLNFALWFLKLLQTKFMNSNCNKNIR